MRDKDAFKDIGFGRPSTGLVRERSGMNGGAAGIGIMGSGIGTGDTNNIGGFKRENSLDN